MSITTATYMYVATGIVDSPWAWSRVLTVRIV